MPIFDPARFLDIAKELTSGPGDESHLRTAAGRAYYATHLRARETLVASGDFRPEQKGEDHQTVIEKLRERGGPEGDILDRLRNLRRRADYRLNVKVGDLEVSRAIELADAIWPRI